MGHVVVHPESGALMKQPYDSEHPCSIVVKRESQMLFKRAFHSESQKMIFNDSDDRMKGDGTHAICFFRTLSKARLLSLM